MEPPNLPAPQYAFARLKECYASMLAATTFQGLSAAWEQYLNAHQRVWNKLEAQYRLERFWQPIKARYKRERDTNTTLVYLHQARHVDEHGIAPVAAAGDGSLSISGPGHFYGMRVSGSGDVTLAPGSTVQVVLSPATVLARPVTNRGVTYKPPTREHHAGPPVTELAEAGIEFYERVFAEVDEAARR